MPDAVQSRHPHEGCRRGNPPRGGVPRPKIVSGQGTCGRHVRLAYCQVTSRVSSRRERQPRQQRACRPALVALYATASSFNTEKLRPHHHRRHPVQRHDWPHQRLMAAEHDDLYPDTQDASGGTTAHRRPAVPPSPRRPRPVTPTDGHRRQPYCQVSGSNCVTDGVNLYATTSGARSAPTGRSP